MLLLGKPLKTPINPTGSLATVPTVPLLLIPPGRKGNPRHPFRTRLRHNPHLQLITMYTLHNSFIAFQGTGFEGYCLTDFYLLLLELLGVWGVFCGEFGLPCVVFCQHRAVIGYLHGYACSTVKTLVEKEQKLPINMHNSAFLPLISPLPNNNNRTWLNLITPFINRN